MYSVSQEKTKFTNPTEYLSHIPQCNIQVNDALWDMGQVQCGIC